MLLIVVPVTTPKHVVDHKWSIEVPEQSEYTWVSVGVFFLGEYVGGGAGGGAGDHSGQRC